MTYRSHETECRVFNKTNFCIFTELSKVCITQIAVVRIIRLNTERNTEQVHAYKKLCCSHRKQIKSFLTRFKLLGREKSRPVLYLTH